MDHALNIYQICPGNLSSLIDSNIIDRHNSQLSYYYDFMEGPAAKAYDLVADANIIPIDRNGCGAENGVELLMETANRPAKELYIDEIISANWLTERLLTKGIRISCEFI